MFENIINFFKKSNRKELAKSTSKDAAKERLHLVLMQDRANVSADFLDLMRQEIIEVIKKYIDIDESAMDVRLTNQANEDGTQGAPALYANIPILSIKEESRNIKIEKEEKTEVKEEPKREKASNVEEKEENKENENQKKSDDIKKEENNKKDENKKVEHKKEEQNKAEENKPEVKNNTNEEKKSETTNNEKEKIEKAKKIVKEEKELDKNEEKEVGKSEADKKAQ